MLKPKLLTLVPNPTPIYDQVMYDLEIDPHEQQGHDFRVHEIIKNYPSKISQETTVED